MENMDGYHEELGLVLARAWNERDNSTPNLALADERALFRHSLAGACARRLYYEITAPGQRAGVDMPGSWAMGLGSVVHDLYQQALPEDFEVEVDCYIERSRSAGHIDAAGVHHDEQIVIELKTMNGTGYRQILQAGKPRTSAAMQGALNAYAWDADVLLVVVLPMENVSAPNAAKMGIPDSWRYGRTFVYPRKEYMPLANLEIDRLAQLAQTIETTPPVRMFVDDGAFRVVVDPANGACADGKKTWHCSYCPFQAQCMADAAQEDGAWGMNN